MLHRTTYSLMALLLLLLAVALPSCIYDTPATEAPSQPEYALNMEVTLPVYDTSSRAPSNGLYDPGTDTWENYIDVAGDMHVYFFGTDNSILFELSTDSTYVAPLITGEGSPYKRYVVRGFFGRKLPSAFKTLVLANCGPSNYPTFDPAQGALISQRTGAAITTLDQLCEDVVFSHSAPLTHLSAEQLIPMFGLKETAGAEFLTDEAVNIGQINMLRSMAKIEITVKPDADWTGIEPLQDVYLTRGNSQGLVMPRLTNWKEDEYVKGSYKADYVDHISLIGNVNETGTGAPTDMALAPNGVTPAGYSRWVIYVPEYDNTSGTNHNTAKLQLLFANEYTYRTVELKYYSKEVADAAGNGASVGDYFDVQRNFYYKYEVSKIDQDLNIIAQVYPYTSVTLKPVFGIDYNISAYQHDVLWLSALRQMLAQTLYKVKNEYFPGDYYDPVWTDHEWIAALNKINADFDAYEADIQQALDDFENHVTDIYVIVISKEMYQNNAADIQSLPKLAADIIERLSLTISPLSTD